MRSLKGCDLNMAGTEFKVNVGVELVEGDLTELKNKINGTTTEPIKLNINTEEAERKLKAIKNQIQELNRMKVTLNVDTDGRSGKKSGTAGTEQAVQEANKDFNKLKKVQQKIKSLRFELSGLDAKDDVAQIQKLESKISKLQAAYNNLYGTTHKDLSADQIRELNKEFDATIPATKQTIDSYEKLRSTLKSMNNIEVKLSKLDGNKNVGEVKELITQFDALKRTYSQLRASLSGQLSSGQLAKLDAEIESTTSKITVAKAKIKDALSIKFTDSSISEQLSRIKNNLSKVATQSEETRQAMQRFEAASKRLTQAMNSGDTDRMVKSANEYEKALKDVENQIKINSRLERQSQAANRLSVDRDALNSKIEVWLKNNSAAAKEFGARLQQIQTELKDCNRVTLDRLKSEFSEITRQAQIAGKTGMSFGDSMKAQFSKLGTYLLASTGIMEVVQGLRYALQNVLAVDSAMTELYRVSDLTSSEYANLYDNMTESAKNYGVALSDLIHSTADWTKQGFDATTANGLAEVSTMYQHIGDISVQEADENLITAYNGFRNQLLEMFNGDEVKAVSYAADIFNELGNNYAIEAGQVGDALTRCASALDIAGNTIQESAGMVTGITEVTQDPEKAGSALKILSLRLRGMKGELEEIESGASEGVESISKMQTQVLNMTGGKVNIFDENGDFKSTYEIMDGIAEIYDSLSTVQQADLLETIAGKNRANDVAALIQNWSQVEKATASAMDAEGSAAKEHSTYLESMQGRLDTLKASWQALSNTMFNSKDLAGLVGGFTGFVDVLDTVIDKVGMLPLLLGGLAAALSFKNIGIFKTVENQASITGKRITTIFEGAFKNIQPFSLDKQFVSQLNANKAAINQYQQLLKQGNVTGANAVLQSMAPAMQEYARQVANGTMTLKQFDVQQRQSAVAMAAQNKSLKNCKSLIATYNDSFKQVGLTQAQTAQAIGQSNQVLGRYLSNVKSGSASLGGYIASLVAAKVATFALEAATIALNTALTMGIAFAITAIISAIDKFIVTAEELEQQVDDIITKFEEQKESADSAKSTIDEVGERYAQLSKGVNSLGQNMSLSSSEYEEYLDITNQLAEAMPSLVQGYDAQGNAILTCKGSVEELNEAYKEYLKTINDEVLAESEDIFKNFRNAQKDFESTGTLDTKYSVEDNRMLSDIFDSKDIDATIEKYESAEKKARDAFTEEYTWSGNGKSVYAKTAEEVGDSANSLDESTDELSRIAKKLEDSGIDRKVTDEGIEWLPFDDVKETDAEFIKRAVTENKAIVSSVLEQYENELEAEADKVRTIAEAYISNAFLSGDYKNISEDMQTAINSMVSSMDYDFFSQFQTEDEMWTYFDDMLGKFNNLTDGQQKTVETIFDLTTQYNNGEISSGEYKAAIEDFQSVMDAVGIDEETQKQINLALGFDEEGFEADYDNLISELQNKGMGQELAKGLTQDLNSSEFQIVFDAVMNGQIDDSDIKEFQDMYKEAVEAGANFDKTMYGNVNLNDRQILHWNDENLEKYKNEIMSWPRNVDKAWADVKSSMEGGFSTVEGMSSTFTDAEIPIAFTPILQTDSGAVALGADTMDKYVNALIDKAKADDGKWTNEELIALDAEGIEIDGQRISNVIADIGDTAEATAASMHYLGSDGALLTDTELGRAIEEAKVDAAMSYTIDIDAEIEGIEKVNTALAEMNSATGLSTESISNLESRFGSLESYDPAALFEKTATGVRLNQQELQRLNAELESTNLADVQNHIDTLTNKYNDVTEEIDKCANASERAALIAERETYATQIEQLQLYEAQLMGTTNAFKAWEDAQNTANSRDGYESIAKGRETIEEEMSRGWFGDDTKAYIDMFMYEDMAAAGATFDDYVAGWKKMQQEIGNTGFSMNDFFTLDDEGNVTSKGIDNFFEAVEKDFGEGYARIDEKTGDRIFDFSDGKMEEIAKEWGMGTEAIQKILEGALESGYEVDWESLYGGVDLATSDFETLTGAAEAAQTSLNEITGENYSFNFEASDLETATNQVEEAQEAYTDLITNDDGSINLNADGAEEMRMVLSTLLIQKQQLNQPAIMSVTVTGDTEIDSTIAKIQDIQTKYNNLEIAVTTGVGIEEAQAELNTALGSLESKDYEVMADLKIGGDNASDVEASVQAAIDQASGKKIEVGTKLDTTSIGTLQSTIQTQCTPKVIAKVTGYTVSEEAQGTITSEGTVNWGNNTAKVDNYAAEVKKATGEVDWDNDTSNVKKNFSASGTVTWTSGNNVKVTVVKTAGVDGTAHVGGTAHASGTAFANGTVGNAFKQGDWGTKDSGIALGGEMGQELIVRDGKFFTIGDDSAEFFHYKKNDIIFNAEQTRQIFEKGKILYGSKRGHALSSGTAFAGGSAPTQGRAFLTGSPTGSGSGGYDFITSLTTTTTTTTTSSSKKSSSKKSSNSSSTKKKKKSSNTSSSSSSKDFKETFDWIETKIKRLEQSLDSLGRKADSVYRTWGSRNKALGSSITNTKNMINLQEKAATRYLKQANKVGLAAKWRKKVQNGTIDISTVTNENTAEKIKEYQEWYEKFKECKAAADEYRESLKELYSQRFDNAMTRYEGILGDREHNSSILEERISQSEEKGQIVNTKYYDALKKQKNAEINTLENERALLVALRDEAVKSGAVAKYSEEWYRMNAEIDACTLAIEEGETALIEYNNAIRDIEWETFDLQLERIQQLNDEAEFLIDLMSNKELYDDKGNLTDEGMATMGLHAQSYNVYMEQAKKYADEIDQLNKDITKDPKNQDLIDRRDELIEAQRKSILAAEDEKEALRDLVEEGIDFELEALQERIDKYNEALKSQKDLYDYQKRVKEQTKEIASLEKQMAAYAGDDSEEAKAKIQELKVSLEEAKADLEETEYDKYVSDQEELLDDLYTEYEELLNTRLDNIDVLLEEQIASANDNAYKIGKTIEAVAKAVGYDVSNETSSIWNNTTKKDSVTTYNNGDADSKTDTQTAVDKADDDVKPGGANTTIPDATNPNQNNEKIDFYDKVKLKSGTNYFSTASGKKSNGKSSKKGTTKKINWLYITDIAIGKAYPYRLSWKADGATGHLGWVRLNGTKGRKNFTGYATGKEELLKDEVAWTQEKGAEFIVRPSDGAILTPLAQGDSVLNAEASGNIWNMANSPADFIRENLGLGEVNASTYGNSQNTIENNFDKIVFSFPNVTNYDEFIIAMTKDRNVERFVKSITTDLIAGKSKLAKGKSIR